MESVHRILIVDDNAVNRAVAQGVFRKLDWQVETLDSGVRALGHLATHPYDLVLLDINMPEMNGLQVCQHIRADPRLTELWVVAYTAHAMLDEQARFLDGGFDAVLVKPISFRAVQELLRGGKEARPVAGDSARAARFC